MNGFKELQKEHEEQYSQNLANIKGSIDSNLASIGTLTQVIETYISKLMNYFLAISGGKLSDKPNEDK